MAVRITSSPMEAESSVLVDICGRVLYFGNFHMKAEEIGVRLVLNIFREMQTDANNVRRKSGTSGVRERALRGRAIARAGFNHP